MIFTAAGDAIIQRRIPKDYEGLGEIAAFINKGDVKFFNLETTINREGECYANRLSGGTFIRTNPEALEDLKMYGFNATSANNNHALDFSYGGLERTIEALDKSGLVHAGLGHNLAQASAPRYIDTANGRAALIAINTTFNPSMMAGKQTERVAGRPGINGIRTTEKLTVTQDELEFIRELAKKLKINVEREIDRAEGYIALCPDNVAEFGNISFTMGEETKREIVLNEEDMSRIERAIYEAKFAADYVMISLHSHEIDGDTKEEVPKFLEEIAHRCIDMGADAIVGHGPHLLRAIEVYNQKPIFYSLGDFICELYSVEFAPADFFSKFGMDANVDTVHGLLKTRSRDFTVGLMEDRKMMETVIPYWETDENGDLVCLKLLPLELGMKCKKSLEGLPYRAKSNDLVNRLAEISKPYGVEMTIEADGTVSCRW